MANQSFNDAALKTAMWWSEKAFRTPMNQNNGDNSQQGGFTFLLQNMVASKAQETVTDEKIKAFENKLVELLEEYHEKWPESQVWLDVDYNPCEMLYKAANYAGLDSNCFPCKSSTIIEKDGCVKAKYQYGSPFIEV